VRLLLGVLHRLADRGNTIIVIEHHMDVIKTADWVIDMGPDGGFAGGTVVAQGPPERIASEPSSHTGKHLSLALETAAVRRTSKDKKVAGAQSFARS
jgi:excinuclease ABC subunit A